MKLLIFTFLSFLFLTPPGLAQTGSSLFKEFHDLEFWLRDPATPLDERREAAQILSELYARDDRPQEAVWTLRAGLYEPEAHRIEIQLQQFFQTQVLEELDRFKGGDNPILMSLGDTAILGLFKNQIWNKKKQGYETNALYEVIAYALDRILSLNTVPITIGRRSTDGTMGSLQYIIRNANSKIFPQGLDDFSSGSYPEYMQKMWLLDYLILNRDRVGGNWLRRFGNEAVAIDHGSSMHREAEYFWQDVGRGIQLQEELLPQGEQLEALRSIKAGDFEPFLAPFRNSGVDVNQEVQNVLAQRDILLEAVERQTGAQCGTSLGQ